MMRAPGYGFSGKPATTGWDVHRIARAWAGLMTRLGYQRFLAQGSDWGTSVSTSLAQQVPGRLLGIHLVPPLAPPDRAATDLTGRERAALADLDERTRTGASSARLYWESIAQVTQWFTTAAGDTVTVPAGCSVFPKEVPRPSRRWAQRRFTNIVHWNGHPVAATSPHGNSPPYSSTKSAPSHEAATAHPSPAETRDWKKHLRAGFQDHSFPGQVITGSPLKALGGAGRHG